VEDQQPVLKRRSRRERANRSAKRSSSKFSGSVMVKAEGVQINEDSDEQDWQCGISTPSRETADLDSELVCFAQASARRGKKSREEKSRCRRRGDEMNDKLERKKVN
jgi:hypothetical protein